MLEKKRIIRQILAFTYIAALSLGLFSTVLDGSLLLVERDLGAFFIQPRLLWAEAIRNGEMPLWNPYYFSGHPLLATLQPGIFYPVNILLLFLPFDLAFNWTVVIHFTLSGIFMFALMRELKASAASSVTGALTFMLSGYLFSVHNVMSTLFSVTWVPLEIIFFLRALKKGSIFYSCASGIVLAVMFTGGGIEVLFGTVSFLALLLFVPSIFDFGEPRAYSSFIKRTALFISALAVFLLLSAAQLLPFLELARYSTRAGGLSYLEATTWSFDLKDFIQFFIPDLYGYGVSDEKYWSNQSWLKTVYTGVIPFILSSFLFLERRKKALPFLLAGLGTLLLAMGKNTLFYPLLYSYSPFFNKIRYPVKFLFMTFIFISVAAGLGYGSLEKGADEKKNGMRRVIIALLALSTLAALAFGALNFFDAGIKDYLVSHGIDYPEYNHVRINLFNTKRVLFFLIIFSVTIYGCFNSVKLRKTLPYATIIILSIDLFFAHTGYYGAITPEEYHKKGKVFEFLSKDKGLYRVFVTPRTTREAIDVPGDASERAVLKGMGLEKERVTGYNIEQKVFDVNGLDVMRRGDYSVLYNFVTTQKSADSTNLLPMLNVKYVISLPKIDSREFRLREVIGSSGDKGGIKAIEEKKLLKVYENLNYLPRFFMVTRFRVIKSPEEYTMALTDKRFSPGREVLLEEDPWQDPLKIEAAFEQRKDYIEVVSYTDNSIKLKTMNSTPGILVASESYYPGWKAYVDGRERRIFKADFALRAVPLEAGSHTVRFEYRPLSFRVGAWVSGVTLTALVVSGICFGAGAGRRRDVGFISDSEGQGC